MGRFKIGYNNKFIVDKEATGNVPIVYNGKVIGDIVEGRNRTLSCANSKAEGRILIGDTILDCKDKLMNTDIFVAYFDDSQGGEFPEEASTYELINTYTTSTTFTAPEYGWYQIEVFGASGSGGAAAIYRHYQSSWGKAAYNVCTGGGGGGGGYACSRVKMNKGDTVVITRSSTCKAVINSSLETYSTMSVTTGGSGGDGTANKYPPSNTSYSGTPGVGGTGGVASGGNYKNKNGSTGRTGTEIQIGDRYMSQSEIDDAADVAGGTGGAAGKSGGNKGGAGGSTNNAEVVSAGSGKAGFIKIYRGNTNVEELAPPVSDVLEENDWATISEVSKSGNAQNYWSVGDTKPFVCNGKTYNAQIIGFDHDDVTDSTTYGRAKAGITFQFQELYETAFKYDNLNDATFYTNTSMYGTHMPQVLSLIESELSAVLVGVNKQLSSSYDGERTITNQKLIPPAYVELFGASATGDTKDKEGTKYAYYAAGNSKKKAKVGNSSYVAWCTRTVTGANVYIVTKRGGSDYDELVDSYYVAPIFFV